MLAYAVGGPDCDAAVFAGSTMSLTRPVPGTCVACDQRKTHCVDHGHGHVKPRPGVMETLTYLAKMDAPARTIGIAPMVGEDLFLAAGYVLLENDRDEDFYTVLDDRCPFSLVLQYSADRPKLTWDDEWRACLDYMELLRNEAEHRSLHLSFNGGKVTRNECLHVAALPQGDNPWNLLLVSDSGRTSQELANDLEFRHRYPHVQSCTEAELPTVIRQMGFAPAIPCVQGTGDNPS
jgi:hypothetical protein